MKVPARERSSNGSSKRGDRLPVNWPHQKVHAWAAAVLAMVSRAEGSLSRMTSSLLRVLIIVSLAVGVRAAHPRSPENCFCETWSVGNALGALGGSQKEWGYLPPRQLVHRRTHEVFRRQHLRFMDAGEFPARNFPVCARTRPETLTSLSMADTRCAGILEETEKQSFPPKNKAFPKDRGQRP